MSDLDLEGLDKLAAAYRKLPRPEPSPALDAAILAQARAAVAKPARKRGWPTWIASAAAVTLAVGLAWRVRESDESGQPPPLARQTAPVAAPAVAPIMSEDAGPASAVVAQDAANTRAAAAEPGKPKLHAREREANVADDREAGATGALAKQAPDAKDEDAADKRADALAQPQPVDTVETMAVPPPPPAPPMPAAPAAEAPVVFDEPLPIAAPEPQAFPAPDAAAPARDEGELREKKESPQERRLQDENESGLDGARAEESRKATSEAAPALGASRPAATGATATGGLGFADRRAAELEHVRELLRAGRRNDATRALREFHGAHPDATIPDDLKGLLR